MVADTVDIMKYAPREDASQAAASLSLSLGHALLSKTYMSGLADFLTALHDPQTEGNRWMQNLAATMTVPQGVAGLAHAIDPVVRAHYSLLQTIESRLPFVSENLPPAQTVWGDDIPARQAFMPPFSGTGAAAMLSPITERSTDAEPIDRWIMAHAADFPEGPQGKIGIEKFGPVQSFAVGNRANGQVQLTPEAVHRLQQLAGDGIKGPDGLGLKDSLNALVQGKYPDADAQRQWNEATDADRALRVVQLYNRAKAAAKVQLMRERPDIASAVMAAAQQRQAQLQGQGGQGGQGGAAPEAAPTPFPPPPAARGALQQPRIGGSP
jgi:hypothetical protein